MDRLLERSKYIILIAVIFLLLASVPAFIFGAAKTVSAIFGIASGFGKDPVAVIGLIQIMDTFLIATALLIFGVGLYELFIRDIDLPDWLVIRNLHDLKAKLGSVIVLVMSVTFLKHLRNGGTPRAPFSSVSRWPWCRLRLSHSDISGERTESRE